MTFEQPELSGMIPCMIQHPAPAPKHPQKYKKTWVRQKKSMIKRYNIELTMTEKAWRFCAWSITVTYFLLDARFMLVSGASWMAVYKNRAFVSSLWLFKVITTTRQGQRSIRAQFSNYHYQSRFQNAYAVPQRAA